MTKTTAFHVLASVAKALSLLRQDGEMCMDGASCYRALWKRGVSQASSRPVFSHASAILSTSPTGPHVRRRALKEVPMELDVPPQVGVQARAG